MSSPDKFCWVDKKKKIGYSLKDLDGFLALHETDLRKITGKLEECHNQSLNTAFATIQK